MRPVIRKWIMGIFACVMLSSLIAFSVSAADGFSVAAETEVVELDKSEQPEVPGILGDGSVDNPYLLSSEEQLLSIAAGTLPNALTSYYILQNDIMLQTTASWVPIGANTAFSGVFDGNGFTISGVVLEGSGYSYTGFFGQNSGVIRNLTVEATFSASGTAGILAARNSGIIQNCLTSGIVTSTGPSVGGLVGYMSNNGTVANSASTATVSGDNYVGGLVGEANSGRIINCYAQGNVSGNQQIGGLVGRNYSAIQNCYSCGSVSGNGGGLVGYGGGTVTACYYDSELSGRVDTDRGTPMSTEEMKLAVTYAGWDFETVWAISPTTANGYPYLRAILPVEHISVTGVSLNTEALALTVGEKTSLTATVTPSDATEPIVIWSSANPAVAAVSGGVVTAKSAGTAVITVKTADGGFTASCTVTVSEPAPEIPDVPEVPANPPVIKVSSVVGVTGQTVDVTVSLSNNTGITGAILRIGYDSALTLTNVTRGEAFASLTMGELAVPYLNPLVLTWDGIGNDNSNGTLVTLTFSIPEGMEPGEYPVVISYNADDIYDTNMNDVPIAVVDGKITVKDILFGDYNNDGIINGKDLTMMRRYISGGFDVSSCIAEAADVNLDGKINGKDLTLIRRFISGGFDVILGQP